MKPITSIYIPRIEREIDATFIADVLEKNGIAQVSSIYIEPYKSDVYNRAYIGIKFWHDTESAFNFIVQLRNTSREARLVYNDDNWWPAYINKYPNKLAYSKRVLTLFEEKHVDFYIDLENPKHLCDIVANFKHQINDSEKDATDFDNYLREIDNEQQKWTAQYKCIYSL